MTIKTIKVGIETDAIERFSKVTADQALEELLWNAIDAEASLIEVSLHRNQMDGITRIVVDDDGHGISANDAEAIFGNIGGSLKRLRRRSPKLDRPYHGKEGKGRYKAFSLGRHIEWHSRALTDGSVCAFSVTLDATSAATLESYATMAGCSPACRRLAQLSLHVRGRGAGLALTGRPV